MADRKKIHWKQLGQPKTGGHITVPNIGPVNVYDRDIELAAQLGNNCWIVIEDCSSISSTTPAYEIIQFIPG